MFTFPSTISMDSSLFSEYSSAASTAFDYLAEGGEEDESSLSLLNALEPAEEWALARLDCATFLFG